MQDPCCAKMAAFNKVVDHSRKLEEASLTWIASKSYRIFSLALYMHAQSNGVSPFHHLCLGRCNLPNFRFNPVA